MPVTPDGIVWEASGPSDAPPVVLIHGLGLNRAAWQWQEPALADRYRVIRYDLFGHGESQEPPRPPSLSLFSEQLVALMNEVGIGRAAIVGFSLGGMIARRFAQDHPDRAAALVILNSPHKRSPEAQEAVAARVRQARDHGPASTVEGALERWFTPAFAAANPAMMDQVRRWVMANDPAIYPAVYEVLVEGVEEVVSPDPPLTQPTLVITGDEDFGNGPEMTRAIAAEIEGAEAVILTALRHMALAEEPDAVNRPLLAFLDRHLGGVR